jgi:hypothetical protein
MILGSNENKKESQTLEFMHSDMVLKTRPHRYYKICENRQNRLKFGTKFESSDFLNQIDKSVSL